MDEEIELISIEELEAYLYSLEDGTVAKILLNDEEGYDDGSGE